jgi:hypothetical protein
VKKNKEKEAEKQKARETKAKLGTDFSKGSSGSEAYFKTVNDREAAGKATKKQTTKDNENINMAKAFFGGNGRSSPEPAPAAAAAADDDEE